MWELRRTEADFPWYVCRFQPTPAFEPYRALFDAEPDVTSDDSAIDAWEAWHDKITALGLSLVETGTGNAAKDFLVHIQGNRADFRAIWM